MTKKIVALTGWMVLASQVGWGAAYYNANLANEKGLAYNNTYTLPVTSAASAQGGLTRVSAQVIYSSLSASVDTYSGGTPGTATITVASTQSLVGLAATNKITIVSSSFLVPNASTAQVTVTSLSNLGAGATAQLSILTNTGLTGASLLINGANQVQLVNGTQWATGVVSSMTALNLAAAINNFTSFTNIVATAPAGSSTIYTTTTVNGSLGRGYTYVSTNGSVSTTTFSGGVENAILNINGTLLRNGFEWNAASTTYGTAQSITAAINAMGSVKASWPGGTNTIIYSTVTLPGKAGNSTTIISTPSASLTPSATFYSGGWDDYLQNAIITFNGTDYRNGYLWTDSSGLSSMTAVSIAAMFNTFGTVVASTGAGGVVYSTATTVGQAANAFTLKVSTLGLTALNATFTGGQDTASITINGVVLTAGLQGVGTWAIGATTTTAAAGISSAIVNTPSLSSIVTSTASGTGQPNGGVVYTTTTAIGTSVNYVITASTPSLVVTNGGYFGGANPATTVGSSVINIPGHGYTTGLEVWQSTSSGVRLVPLNWGTTYYVIAIDANNIALALTSTGAVAGNAITILSSSTLAAGVSYALNPLTLAGNSSFKWQASNDGLNWTDLATPAPYSIGTNFVFPSTSTVVDFGDVDYLQIRLNVTAPTAGGLGLKVPINGRL